MLTIEQRCAERVLWARTELTMTRRFYGAAIANVRVEITRDVPTAATDSKTHFWNPDFVATLTQEELLFVQGHESLHDVCHHSTRRGTRDPVLWNVAGDHYINLRQIAEKLGKAPKGALADPGFAGMATEEIYRVLEGLKQKPEQPPEEQDEQDEPEQGGEAQNPGKTEPEQDEDQGDDQGEDQPEDGADPGADDQGEQGPGEPQDEPGEAGGGEGTPEDGEPTQGDPGEAGGAGNAPELTAQAVEAGGDVGGCGVCLDAPGDANDVADQDQDWTKIVQMAESVAKGFGQLPGWVSQEIESANNPPRNWRDELREFCEQGALTIETWNRPNRRHIGRGVVLPSNQRDGVSKAAFLIDTSGSMDKVALACVRDEAQQLLDDGIVNEVAVLYGDVRLTRLDEYITGDEIEFDPKGGGGTNMKPLFDHVAEELSDATLIVCFTDLEFYESMGDEPRCPVLFAAHGHHPPRLKQLMDNAPWGARAIDVGAH